MFMYHDAFNPDAAEGLENSRPGIVPAKSATSVPTKLANAMNAALEPMRARRAELLADPDELRDVVTQGSRRARTIAQATMDRVRSAVKLRY